jgi:hypothetical protein
MKRLTRVPVRLALAIGITLLTAACRHDAASPQFGGPRFAVSDGAHDGNPDFFFLPPLFRNPSSNPDFEPAAFNPNLRPAVEICELGPLAADGSRACVAGPPVKRFDPAAVSVSVADQFYQTNWNTDETNLDVTKFYRIRVLVASQELGFADVDPVNTGKELKSVETGEYIGLVDGRTLPIKFRIENAALCGDSDAPCAAGTINLPTGGGITLITPDEEFHLDIDAGTTALFGNTPVTDVTFNLESCDGIDVDIPTFGDCLRVTTYFDGIGGVGAELVVSDPALISLCVLEPGLSEAQEELVTLHQQDGTLIRALPHATPNCDRLTALPTGLRGLAVRGWRWMRGVATKLVVPTPLYARSRAVAFNLGGGGETDRFGASCSGGDGGEAAAKAEGPLPQLVDCPAASAPLLASTAVLRAPRTISDFQFALPAMMDYVNPDDASRTGAPGDVLPTGVKVTDWHGGAVPGATVTFTAPAIEGPGIVVGTAVSNSDGIAQIDWEIAEGPNAVVASGRGIAAQNNYPGGPVTPFSPDIEMPVAEQETVVLRTGFVPFAAVGVPPMGSLQFLQQPVNTISGEAISPALQIRLFDPSGAPVTEILRVTVGNDPANPESCLILQTSTLAIEGVATFENIIVNGTCTGARVAATAGGADYDFPIIFSEPFDILPIPPTGLDQQNLLDGAIGGQGIGRFSDLDGTPDPDGTSFDLQDAQTFTVGVSGRLSSIKVPLVNLSGATVGVTMQIVGVSDGVPDESQSLGEVTIPASAISTDFASTGNPAQWATFDLTGLEINVEQGQVLAFIVRSLSTSAYIYNPESTLGYPNGTGYRRNRALTTAWSTGGQDFGFQTFVDRGP